MLSHLTLLLTMLKCKIVQDHASSSVEFIKNNVKSVLLLNYSTSTYTNCCNKFLRVNFNFQ